MDKEKQLQDEAINILFFKPSHGFEPDIIQCMMNFAKSDIVKEYHNTDKKYTEKDMLKCLNYLMAAMTNKNPVFFKDYINSLNKQD